MNTEEAGREIISENHCKCPEAQGFVGRNTFIRYQAGVWADVAW